MTPLEADLRRVVRGEVRFDAGSRALYSTDASNYRQLALGVVLPRDARDVEGAIAACRRHGVPVLSRGGGTSLAGETCNEAVVVDFSKYMNRIVAIDWEAKTARVEPGCVTDDLRAAAEERHLTFGPDPATHDRNTLGGMIGNNSCGMHAQMAGKVEENVEELEIVTYDGLRMRVGRTSEEELERIIADGGRRGEIYAGLKELRDRYGDLIRARFPQISRRVSGYNLNELLPENGFNVARALVGTEGTCVTMLEATCRLVHSPPWRTLVVAGYPDIAAAADAVPFCNGFGPIALEGIDESMFRDMHAKGASTESRAMFPDGGAWLIVEFGGESEEEALGNARALADAFASHPSAPTPRVVADRAEQKRFWAVRDNGLGATAKIPGLPDFYPGWEDAAVDPAHLGQYLRDFAAVMERYGYQASLYGHFGQGCVHGSIDFDLFTTAGIAKYRAFVTEAAHLVVKYGGSLSGEHGDGQSRGELLPIMFGDELVEAFWQFKTIWDPQNMMNPGKVSHPRRLDEDLRWGADYQPAEPATHFTFPDDYGSFAFAANRCVGTGKCRKHDAGTMCPSYMATKEEAYSTRGRARLLFEMLRGDPLDDGWANESVKDALDLCLSCKGCKSECPVNVDMATYKAEFLSHYYERNPRPLAAYAFGLMPWWARLASLAPGIANFLTQAPLLGDLAKRAAGVAPQRTIPLFAPQTFRAWFASRPPRAARGREVILWPDTWNNHFHPETARAAVEVLEDAGFCVTLPPRPLCCGRPLYDFGMLGLAKTWLRDALDALGPQIRSGVPLVGLEPSCVSVFRDEMVNLLGDNDDARRLKEQTFLLPEFLAREAPEYSPPPLRRKAVMHQHCHHKSVLDAGAEKRLLERMQLEVAAPDTGCCGMAGPFGFEEKHYDVAMTVGERVLLPSVRAASPQTIVIADGFSCREQVAQATGRQALHPAQVMKMALDHRGSSRDDAYPERRYLPDPAEVRDRTLRRGLAAIAFAGAIVAALGVLAARRR
ncbi:MAG TPA: FAD-linked oxidase C-terminal domain-containing protein [Candidatus Cybelea sp.]|nr:FAD-linked oxidase C-terminal domain-containing protein [Candidatus Cybelea sp.]